MKEVRYKFGVMVQEAVQDYKFPAEEHPLNRQAHQEIGRLLSLSTFREEQRHSPGMSVEWPLLKTEFRDAPSISRLLHLRNRRIQTNEVVVQVKYGWLSLYDDEPTYGSTTIRPRMASLSICAGRSVIALDAGRTIHSNNFLEFDEEKDHLIGANVLFKRRRQKKDESVLEEDLLTRRDISPLRILFEMKTIMGRLRSEFEIQEQRRTELLLTPRQAAAVEVLAKRAKDIREHSWHRGFYDEYVIAAVPSNQGRLEGLTIVFSAGSDNGKTVFKEKEMFNREVIYWQDDNIGQAEGMATLTAREKIDQEHTTSYYSAEGKISTRTLAETGRYRTLFNVPVALKETSRHPFSYGTVADYVGSSFGHFLDHRVDSQMESECKAPVILATSVPLVTIF